jgi:hypothetical protein
MTQWPPWKASSAAERQAMIDAVVAELLREDEHAEALIARWDGAMPLEAVFRSELNAAKQYARRGNIGPLREILSGIDPELAEFIHEPPRIQGQRRPRLASWEQMQAHDEDASQARNIGRVRAIWQWQYGRWKRHASDGPSAAEIVAAYHAVFDGQPFDSADDDDEDRHTDTVIAK